MLHINRSSTKSWYPKLTTHGHICLQTNCFYGVLRHVKRVRNEINVKITLLPSYLCLTLDYWWKKPTWSHTPKLDLSVNATEFVAYQYDTPTSFWLLEAQLWLKKCTHTPIIGYSRHWTRGIANVVIGFKLESKPQRLYKINNTQQSYTRIPCVVGYQELTNGRVRLV